VWCERQIEVRTAYDIRLTTSALAGLLAAPHPALDAMQVGSAWFFSLVEACVGPSPAQPSCATARSLHPGLPAP
jgi:hypothetical protein